MHDGCVVCVMCTSPEMACAGLAKYVQCGVQCSRHENIDTSMLCSWLQRAAHFPTGTEAVAWLLWQLTSRRPPVHGCAC